MQAMKHLISSGAVSESDISVVDCPYLSRPPQALLDLLTSPEGNPIVEEVLNYDHSLSLHYNILYLYGR
jgi:hypothetical protein